MNVEIVTEAAQFLFLEYITGIFIAVQITDMSVGMKQSWKRKPWTTTIYYIDLFFLLGMQKGHRGA